jgi:hypothetical protein
MRPVLLKNNPQRKNRKGAGVNEGGILIPETS